MAAEIDQQFVEYIVKALVSNPDAVKIDRTIDEKGVLLKLEVDPQDLGRVIGRNGITAKSIRTLLRALGVKNDARYNLKIVDTNEGESSAPAPVQEQAEAPAESEAETSESQTDHEASEAQPSTTAGEGEDSAAEPEEEKEEQEEDEEEEDDSVSRHREEIEGLTDLDI